MLTVDPPDHTRFRGTVASWFTPKRMADLRAPVRASQDDALLFRGMDEAIARKPKGHDFIIDRRHNGPAVGRHMSVTGG